MNNEDQREARSVEEQQARVPVIANTGLGSGSAERGPSGFRRWVPVVVPAVVAVLGGFFTLGYLYLHGQAQLLRTELRQDVEGLFQKHFGDVPVLTGELADLKEQIGVVRDASSSVGRDIASVKDAVGRLAPEPTKKNAVFLVMPNPRDRNQATAGPMIEGFVSAFGASHRVPFDRGCDFWLSFGPPGRAVNQQRVEIVYVEDREDPGRTVTELRSKLADYNCLLVVGHNDSTAAMHVAGSFYYENRIPVILLGPTNPDLTANAPGDKTTILRLLPTDRVQVARLVSVVNGVGRYSRVLIMQDGTNSRYSKYIADELQMALTARRATSRVVKVADEIDMRLLRVEVQFEQFKPDLLICVGLHPTTRLYLEKIQKASRKLKSQGHEVDMVFTDGCTAKDFARFMASYTGFRRALLFSPMPPAPNGHIDGGIDAVDYRPLGVVAGSLTYLILEEANCFPKLDKDSVVEAMRKFIRRPYSLNLPPFADRSAVKVPAELMTVNFRGGPDTVVGDNQHWRYYIYGIDSGNEDPTTVLRPQKTLGDAVEYLR
ncbi:MAG: ABC transporter substrate-binding protein [bacterium]|nr:ABC transporter substrate-binding protein [bacterium]